MHSGGFMQKVFIVSLATVFLSTVCYSGGDGSEKSPGGEPQHSTPSNKEESTSAEIDSSRMNDPLPDEHWKENRDLFGVHGISFSLGYKADNFSNFSGGLKQTGSYLHNIDLTFGIDAERLLNWKGGSFFLQAISNNGGGLSKSIGSTQQISNIDAPKVAKLYQAWFQQNLMDGKLSFLAGLYDLNTEFYLTQASRVFLNRSFSVGKELSQTGNNGPSIFPNTSAALRVRLHASDSWSFQFAVLDAVPGSLGMPLTPSLFLSTDEGALVVNEVAFSWKGLNDRTIGRGKYTLGSWFYTAAFNEIQAIAYLGQSLRSTANNGVYLMAEQNVFSETDDPAQGLALFSRVGFANGRINQYNHNWSFGGTYTGLFGGQDSDVLSVGATYVNVSSEYKNAKHIANEPIASGEMVIEVTYRAQLTNWLAIQPDVQRIIHPGTNLAVENATVFGSRIEVGF